MKLIKSNVIFLLIASLMFFSGCATTPNIPPELIYNEPPKANIPLDKIKVVALINFKNLSDDKGAGQKVIGAFTQELINIGRFNLVEREQIDKAIQELALSQTSLIDAGKIKQTGEFLGADALIVGEITNLDHITENLKYDYSNQGLKFLPIPPDEADARGFKVTSEKRSYTVQKYTAGISFNIRLIDSSTARVIWAKNISKSFSLFDGEYGYHSVYTLLDKLTSLAVKEAVSELRE
ncbi:MAG: hypothetical protein HY934_10815 [Candidatus Firestonebacteria bacterium]|nr:hypothetical protein [Candidatus Firestonebacteria bacterium]